MEPRSPYNTGGNVNQADAMYRQFVFILSLFYACKQPLGNEMISDLKAGRF